VQRRKIREDKAVLGLSEECQTLSRALWSAPLVDLDVPHQRGWYREFDLTAEASRRGDVNRLEELLIFVNNVQCCRRGKFLKDNYSPGKKVPSRHRLRRFSLCELKQLKFPESLYRYLRHEGGFRIVTKEVLEQLPFRWSGKFVVKDPQYFVSVVKPLIITQRKVDMPETRKRIDEIDGYFERIRGWDRWRRLRGYRWRKYEYSPPAWRRREQQEIREVKEGTMGVVPFSLVVPKGRGIAVGRLTPSATGDRVAGKCSGTCQGSERRRHCGRKADAVRYGRSIIPIQQVVGNVTQTLTFFPKRLQRFVRFLRQSRCFFAALLQSEKGGVGGFVRSLIFPGAFAEFLAGLGDVEDVVDDLKREPEGFTVGREGFELSGRRVGAHGPESD